MRLGAAGCTCCIIGGSNERCPAAPHLPATRWAFASLVHVTRLIWQPAALVAPGASPRPGGGLRPAVSSPVSSAACRRAAVQRTGRTYRSRRTAHAPGLDLRYGKADASRNRQPGGEDPGAPLGLRYSAWLEYRSLPVWTGGGCSRPRPASATGTQPPRCATTPMPSPWMTPTSPTSSTASSTIFPRLLLTVSEGCRAAASRRDRACRFSADRKPFEVKTDPAQRRQICLPADGSLGLLQDHHPGVRGSGLSGPAARRPADAEPGTIAL
jgi:hypothetical protein